MAVFLSPVGGVAAQFFTNTGVVLTGGKLYTYSAGTTTPAATYTSAAGVTFNTNPIILDAAGRVPGSGEIWIGSSVQYKFVLKDSNDVLIATYDNISGINSTYTNFTSNQEIQTATAGQTVFSLANPYVPGANNLSVFVDGVNQYGPGATYAYIETSANTVTFVSGLHVGASVKFTTVQSLTSTQATTAALVSYTPAGTGAVVTTVQAKLRQYVSVIDFGADPTGTTDSTAAIQAAINSANAQSSYGAVFLPDGTYKCSNLTLKHGVKLFGNSPYSCVISVTDTTNPCIITQDYTEISNVKFYYPNQVTNAVPTVYPATITCITSAAYINLNNLQVQGAYNFIVFGSASVGVGPVFIENITGFPLHQGIVLDNTIDTVRITNVHFNPNIYGGYGATLLAWVYQNAYALYFLRVDGPQVVNFLCFGYFNGLYTAVGNPSGSANMGTFTNCLFDVCKQPINLVNYQNGMFFSNCIFTTGGSAYNGITGGINFIGTNNAVVQAVASFSNCSFRTYYTSIFNITTNCEFTNCQFDDYNQVVGAYAAINTAYSGVDIKITACYFDTKSRANTQGIASGSTTVSLGLQGNSFVNFTGTNPVNIKGYLYSGGNSLGGTNYVWNGIVCQDTSGMLMTYQIPSAFTVTAPFTAGSYFGNYTPAVGSPKGWICTVSGTPGTWVSTGNL